MLKHMQRMSSAKLARIQELSPLQFDVFTLLDTLRARRIALAVSGGVDSMALATLCSQAELYTARSLIYGFIVDHGVRAESHYEAKNVADELRKLNIRPCILKLDWSAHGNPRTLSNFETVARKLRYQALGRACVERKVQSLLLGHHQDDRAETMLARLVAGYTGNLTGMRSKRPIPECEGMYGVHESGQPYKPVRKPVNRSVTYMRMESGGVRVHRPLLPFKKDELKQVCTAAGTKWFEDRTNADRTLTLRNTIRHLQSTSQLPAALQNDRIAQAIGKLSARTVAHEKKAKLMFDTLSIKFNPAVGYVILNQPISIEADSSEPGAEYHVKALVTKKVLELVSPTSVLSLQDLDLAVDALFQSNWSGKVQVAKVDITMIEAPADDHQKHSKQIMVHRSHPNRGIAVTFGDTVFPMRPLAITNGEHRLCTDYIVFDNRFWMRMRSPPLHRLRSLESSLFSEPPHDEGREANQERHTHGSSELSGASMRVHGVDIAEALNFRFSVRFLDADIMRSLNEIVRGDKQAQDALKACLSVAPGNLRWNLPVVLFRKRRNNTEVVQETEEIFGLPSVDWRNMQSSAYAAGWAADIRYKSVDFGAGEQHVFEPRNNWHILAEERKREREAASTAT